VSLSMIVSMLLLGQDVAGVAIESQDGFAGRLQLMPLKRENKHEFQAGKEVLHGFQPMRRHPGATQAAG
jgi:hypothetical protein